MLRPRIAIAGAIVAALFAVPAASVAASETSSPTGPAPSPPSDRVIVEWVAGASHGDRVTARDAADVTSVRGLGAPEFQLVRLEPGQSLEEALTTLQGDPVVQVAEADGYSTPNGIPNDPLFGQLWGLRNLGLGIDGFVGAVADKDIGAVAAWDRTVGTPSTVIADLDTGYRFADPDLGPVAWANPADPPGGGDNDANGIVDDSHGADFVGQSVNSPAIDGDPTDDNLIDGGHGIHTAGTMGAAGNNGVGITGVARNARIMPLRVCSYYTDPTPTPVDESGTLCPTSSQIQAINYAGLHGARVANMSLGGTSPDTTVRDAFAANPQTLFVISAGNDGSDNDSGAASPHGHHYPCDYNPATSGITGAIDNIVCVAATNQADGLASFSDWGATSVDLGAPGTETLSTFPTRTQHFGIDFEANDFASTWTSAGSGFGRAAPGDGPLTSFGMNDSPGGAPGTGSTHQVTLSTGVPIPPGSGACTFAGLRFRHADSGSSFSYSVLADDVSVFTNTGSTNTGGSAMAAFSTVPIMGLAGHAAKVRFTYTAGSAPSAADGIWLDDLKLTCYAPLSTPLSYEFLQGTSMAAPHVTGAAALLFSLKPTATVAEVRNALLSSVTPAAALSGKTTTGGRLNAAAALNALVPVGQETVAPDTAISGAPPGQAASGAATFSFARTDADAGSFECKLDGAATWTACTSPASYSVGPGPHQFQVRAKAPNGVVDPTPATHSWTVEPPPPSPQPPPPPPQNHCTVPKLAGKTLSQAKAALGAAGCTLGKVAMPRARKGKKLPPLVVKSSTPGVGASPGNGTVSLILGPKPKPKKHHR